MEGGLTGLTTATKYGLLSDSLKCPETKTSCKERNMNRAEAVHHRLLEITSGY